MGKRIRIGLAAGAAAMISVLTAAPAPALAAEPDCYIYDYINYPPDVYEALDCAAYLYTGVTGASCDFGGGYIGDELRRCLDGLRGGEAPG